MEKIYRALGMVDKNGNVFDETKVREQVMSALGVSNPSIETVPAPKPPFRHYEDCCEACLALPSPEEPEFGQMPESAQALSVLVMLDAELSGGGVAQYLWSCGSAYAMRTPESLRVLGLDGHAAAFESFLERFQLDASSIDAMHPADTDDETTEKLFDDLNARLTFDGFEKTADWSELPRAILQFANEHPEAFITGAAI